MCDVFVIVVFLILCCVAAYLVAKRGTLYSGAILMC